MVVVIGEAVVVEEYVAGGVVVVVVIQELAGSDSIGSMVVSPNSKDRSVTIKTCNC